MSDAEAFLNTALIHGERVTSLYDQWMPQDVIMLADDISCLTLSDAFTGRQAVWYFDGGRNYCGSHIEVIERLQASDVLSTVAPWFDALMRSSVSTKPEALHDAPVLPLFLSTQLAAAWFIRTVTDLHQIQTALLDQDREIAQLGDNKLSTRAIRRLLGTRIRPETLVVVSPLTGAPLRSQTSFVVNHQLIHRFYDPEPDCAFYLAWWEKQLDKPPTFYCPKANIVVSDDGMAGMLPSLILGWYLSNPDHVETISTAQVFEARDYGLGHASSLKLETEEAAPTAPENLHTAAANKISEAWAFIHQHQPEIENNLTEHTAVEKKDTKKSGRLFGRLRSFVKKK